MVDNKTGGLLRLLLDLLQAERSIPPRDLDFQPLVLLLGRFFQIRDDYMNLQSPGYGEQKGFCEDLDEGDSASGRSSWRSEPADSTVASKIKCEASFDLMNLRSSSKFYCFGVGFFINYLYCFGLESYDKVMYFA